MEPNPLHKKHHRLSRRAVSQGKKEVEGGEREMKREREGDKRMRECVRVMAARGTYIVQCANEHLCSVHYVHTTYALPLPPPLFPL